MTEIWKDIKNYEGLYQVSNLGRVKNSRTDRIIKPYRCCGYLQLLLCKNGKVKHYIVHRLVAEAFIENPNSLPEVDHINRDKTDNKIENLRWADRKIQIRNSNREPIIKAHNIPVEQYTLDGQFVTEYQSAAEAERQTGINHTKISLVCQGKRNKTGGYVWKYK